MGSFWIRTLGASAAMVSYFRTLADGYRPELALRYLFWLTKFKFKHRYELLDVNFRPFLSQDADREPYRSQIEDTVTYIARNHHHSLYKRINLLDLRILTGEDSLRTELGDICRSSLPADVRPSIQGSQSVLPRDKHKRLRIASETITIP